MFSVGLSFRDALGHIFWLPHSTKDYQTEILTESPTWKIWISRRTSRIKGLAIWSQQSTMLNCLCQYLQVVRKKLSTVGKVHPYHPHKGHHRELPKIPEFLIPKSLLISFRFFHKCNRNHHCVVQYVIHPQHVVGINFESSHPPLLLVELTFYYCSNLSLILAMSYCYWAQYTHYWH